MKCLRCERGCVAMTPPPLPLTLAACLAFAASMLFAPPLRAQHTPRFHLVDARTGGAAQPAIPDEATFVLTTAQLVAVSGRLPPAESRVVVPTMRAAYARLLRDEGAVPSPWTAEPPGPMLVIEPPRAAPSSVGIVFLHGAGGSFAVQCSWLARAGARLNARTVCPSAGREARWTAAADRAELDRAIAYLRAHGATHIYVAGLSNGAVGLSRLAQRLARTIDGFMLISGAAAGTRPTRRPTLVIQSRDDHMTPPRLARAYVRGAGRHVRYVELDGTHFVFAERTDALCTAIADWLDAQQR